MSSVAPVLQLDEVTKTYGSDRPVPIRSNPADPVAATDGR